MSARASIPPFSDLLWPTLQSIKSLGDSGRIDEIVEAVIEARGFTPEQQAEKRRDGDRMSLIEYRLAWARNYLKNIGALENSARGVWAITDFGRALTEPEVWPLVQKWKTEYNKAYLARRKGAAAATELSDDDGDESVEQQEVVEEHWKDTLLGYLMAMEPSAFERLAQRLLREANFRSVEVLGKSNDGGIDGTGVYRVSLISFRVFFQCKRYKGTVSPSHVRDFRGAMSGRGDKGLLITTGTFSKEARLEANRDGAPPVDLVDGDDLCELLKEYGLGVYTTTRTVEDVSIEPTFFDAV